MSANSFKMRLYRHPYKCIDFQPLHWSTYLLSTLWTTQSLRGSAVNIGFYCEADIYTADCV
jgi:hypothetical protein